MLFRDRVEPLEGRGGGMATTVGVLTERMHISEKRLRERADIK